MLPSICYVVAASTCVTPPRDSPKNGWNFVGYWVLFPVVADKIRAGKTGYKTHLLRLSLFFLPFLYLCLLNLGRLLFNNSKVKSSSLSLYDTSPASLGCD